MSNNNITDFQLEKLLPHITECVIERIAKNNKTDLLLITDHKDVVNTVTKEYPEDSLVSTHHLFHKEKLFAENYNLWIVYTKGAHPRYALKEDYDHVEQVKFLTRPRDYEKYLKETESLDWGEVLKHSDN